MTPPWLRRVPIAHRGLHGPGVPENSPAAFLRASRMGYAVELDVRLLADGNVIVFHDVDLARLTGARGRIDEHTKESAIELRLQGGGEHPPLLAEVLTSVSVPLLIEVKNEGMAGAIEPAVADLLREHHGRFALQSFNAETVSWFKANLPDVACGFLTSSDISPAMTAKADFVGVDIRSLPLADLPALRTAGVPVLVWTVRSESERRDVLPHCDNIIFEHFLPAIPADEPA